MRKLTEHEIILNKKSIDKMTEDMKELEYSRKYDELLLAEGLEIQFKKTKKKIQDNLKLTNAEIEENKKTIQILQNQIDNGVEEK